MPDQVYSVSWNGVEKVTNKFDSLSRLSKRTVNGLATNYTYKDLEGNQTTTLVESINTGGISYVYDYDEVNNIKSVTVGNKKTTYEYDELNQLTRVNDPFENVTHVYTYNNGNIVYDLVYEYSVGVLPSYPLSATQYLYENATWSDILTGVKKSHFDNGVEIIDDRYSISSDTIGNITNLNGPKYSWLGRQLQSVSNSDNSKTTYSYNADGQRIAKAVNSANGDEYNYRYYYNGNILAGYKLVITKSDGSSTTHNVAFMYDENGEAFGIDINGKEYFYVKNAQNDVIAIVNSNNETVATYRYNSWGKLISCEDTSKNQEVSFLNPYTYRSYFYDSDTEMYFLKSRYYNPELHRFISADGIYDTNTGILSHNMFAYCNDEPINRMDIFGTCYYNINGKWCHDNWEYLGGYNRKPEPIDITDKLNDAMHKNAETMNDSKRTKGTVKTATMFYNNVKPGGKWDFKAQKDWGLDSQHIYLYNGTQLRYDDIGNIHYGYVGRTLFSKKTLLLAAGGVQIYTKTSSISYWNSNFDDPRDQWAIEFGCGIWDSEVLS